MAEYKNSLKFVDQKTGQPPTPWAIAKAATAALAIEALVIVPGVAAYKSIVATDTHNLATTEQRLVQQETRLAEDQRATPLVATKIQSDKTALQNTEQQIVQLQEKVSDPVDAIREAFVISLSIGAIGFFAYKIATFRSYEANTKRQMEEYLQGNQYTASSAGLE